MSQTKAQLLDGKSATIQFTGGSASAPSVSFTGDTNTGIYSPGADQVAISTGGSGRLFVDSSGNVGVGGSPTPYGTLTVFSSGIGGHINSTSGAAGINFYENGSGRFSLRTLNGSAGLSFYDTFNSTERLRITSAGLVGVGTSSPAQILHCTTTNGTASQLQFTQQFQREYRIGVPASSTSFEVYDVSAGASRLTIDSSGRLGVGTTSPGSTLHVDANGGGILRVSRISSSANNYGQLEHDGSNTTLSSTTNTVFFNNSAERARIDSSGRVGIGTSTVTGYSSNIVHINGATGSEVHLTTGGTGTTAGDGLTLFTRDSDGAAGLFQRENASLLFGTNDQTRVTITSGGSVGIGTTSPAKQLHIESTSSDVTLRIGRNGYVQTDLIGSTGAGANDFKITQNGFDRFVIEYGGNSAARIDSSGRLLVGTSSAPSGGDYSQYSKLVNIGNTFGSGYAGILTLGVDSISSLSAGDDVGVIVFTNRTGNEYARILCEADATTGSGDYPGRLVFSTTADGASSPTERMRIGNNGTVTITQSNTGTYGEYIDFSNGGYGLGIRNASGGNADLVYFFSPNYVGGITTSGSTTSYLSASDYRLKENIALVADSITRLQKLKPIRFNFIADPTKTVDGFIAHEVQAVVPEAITGEKDAVDADGKPIYQGIDQSKLVPLLTAALQEAIGEIESLKARVAALESA